MSQEWKRSSKSASNGGERVEVRLHNGAIKSATAKTQPADRA
jgi:hypothetical protein